MADNLDFSSMSDDELNNFIQSRQPAPSDLSSMPDDALQAHIANLQTAVKRNADLKEAADNEQQQFSWAGPVAPALRSFSAANPAAHIPLVSWGADAAASALSAAAGQGEGGSFSERYNDLRSKSGAEKAVQESRHPVASTVGDLASTSILPTFGATKLGPALGNAVASKLGPGTFSRAATYAGDVAGVGGLAAGYAGATGLENGDTLNEKLSNAGQAAKSAATAGIDLGPVHVPFAAALPLAARGVQAGFNKFSGANVGDPAAQRVREAIDADTHTREKLASINPDSPALGMDFNQWQQANTAGQPWMIGDVGGAETRSLARAAKNLSPEADAYLSNPLQGRFKTQGNRFQDFVDNLYGNGTDPAAVKTALEDSARLENSHRYGVAFNNPNAQAMWNSDLSKLMPNPAMQGAISRANNLAAIDSSVKGISPIQNPFAKDEYGNWQLRQNPDGSVAIPSLRFWDYVKKGLDAEVTNAYRDNGTLGNMTQQLRDKFRVTLDSMVPDYANARAGAAAYFGADNAYDAGANFLKKMDTFKFSDARQALNNMSPSEKQLFETGLASSIANKASTTGDSTNIVRMFDTPQSRQKLQLAMNPDKVNAVETYLRRESMMDMMRTAVGGNSSTTAQLIAAETLGGIEGAKALWENREEVVQHPIGTGSAILGAILGGALLHYNHSMDRTLAPRIGQLLASNKPEDIQRLVNVTSRSAEVRNAIRNAEMRMSQAYGEKMGQSPQSPTDPNRQQRKSGGRVSSIDHKAMASRLVKQADYLKKLHNKSTEPTLGLSDEHVAHALELANQYI